MVSVTSKSFCQMTTGVFLLVFITLALNAREASGVTIYRIGCPFSEAERDSLEGIGVELRELDWSVSILEDALDPDSLQAGILQPHFIGGDDDIAASSLSRGGWVVAQRSGRAIPHQGSEIPDSAGQGGPLPGAIRHRCQRPGVSLL